MPSITSLFSNTSFNPSSSSFRFHITMDLQSNSLESLDQTTFTSLRNLISFPLPTPSSLFLVPFLPSFMSLDYNQLTSLPPDIFDNNANLKNLSILISIPHHNVPSIKLIGITPSINLHQSQKSCFISSSHSLLIIPHSFPPFIHVPQFQSTHIPSSRHL